MKGLIQLVVLFPAVGVLASPFKVGKNGPVVRVESGTGNPDPSIFRPLQRREDLHNERKRQEDMSAALQALVANRPNDANAQAQSLSMPQSGSPNPNSAANELLNSAVGSADASQMNNGATTANLEAETLRANGLNSDLTPKDGADNTQAGSAQVEAGSSSVAEVPAAQESGSAEEDEEDGEEERLPTKAAKLVHLVVTLARRMPSEVTVTTTTTTSVASSNDVTTVTATATATETIGASSQAGEAAAEASASSSTKKAGAAKKTSPAANATASTAAPAEGTASSPNAGASSSFSARSSKAQAASQTEAAASQTEAAASSSASQNAGGVAQSAKPQKGGNTSFNNAQGIDFSLAALEKENPKPKPSDGKPLTPKGGNGGGSSSGATPTTPDEPSTQIPDTAAPAASPAETGDDDDDMKKRGLVRKLAGMRRALEVKDARKNRLRKVRRAGTLMFFDPGAREVERVNFGMV